MDGATPFQIFYKVMLPLVAPGLVTTGLLAFIAAWNEFLYALSFTQTPDQHTVTLAITTSPARRGARSRSLGRDHGCHGDRHPAADRADAGAAAPDPRRPDGRAVKG